MGIILSKVRISNYRSIEYLSLELGLFNLLIGQNNSGKTNFLKALHLAVSGISDLSENDIFVSQDERLERTKVAVIDIMLQPLDEHENMCKEFSEFWTSAFTDSWITTGTEGNFVSIRTEIKFDLIKDSYGLTRRCIRQWGDNFDNATIENRKVAFTEEMRTYLQSFYMDANRDIVQDLRNRKSYFGRVTSSYDLSQETIDEIEEQLNAANTRIINSIPSLQQTKERIATIGQTIGAGSSNVEIEPLARKITDLNKGMDIVMQDNNAASLPIVQHGSGTRSWVSFLALSAFIENQNQRLRENEEAEQFIMLTMEEPEAHLHPHAQRRLFEQISHFEGQKVVSTHSPSIIAQRALTDAIYFSKRDGKTTAIRYKTDEVHGDTNLIFREVINTRADLLFASAVILCEGITEELVLPVFFTEHFRCAPYSLGVSIIGTGGTKYEPYLSLIKDFDIPWFIFSDGEARTTQAVNAAIHNVFGSDINDFANVIILENDNNYEEYLISEGYSELIIEAICDYEEDAKFLESYIGRMNGQKRKGGIKRDYACTTGQKDALSDLCHERKIEYALPIAKKIVDKAEPEKKVPIKIKSLLDKLAEKIGAAEVTSGENI
ncbi:MAG: AAA family ATPase [Dehalococcoidales bacterium]|nr:AAA family ATPase [Dehalococcoidales bacterium]